MPPDNLFLLPGSMRAHNSVAEVYEVEIEALLSDHGPRLEEWVVEEWSALPASHFLPDVNWVAELVAEHAADDMGTDHIWDHWEGPSKDPDVLAAFRAAMELMASKVTYRMCHEKIGEHIVTFDATNRPLADGEPMYREKADA